MRALKAFVLPLLLTCSLAARAETFTYAVTYTIDSFTYTGPALLPLANWDGSNEILVSTTSCRINFQACDQIALLDGSDSIYIDFFQDGATSPDGTACTI